MKDAKRTLKQKAVHEVREYLVISLYLFVVFSLFVFYKSVILAEHHIDFALHGLALINALALAKVMLVCPGAAFGRPVPGCAADLSDSSKVLRVHDCACLFQDC